jgi:hypothetical protein
LAASRRCAQSHSVSLQGSPDQALCSVQVDMSNCAASVATLSAGSRSRARGVVGDLQIIFRLVSVVRPPGFVEVRHAQTLAVPLLP